MKNHLMRLMASCLLLWFLSAFPGQAIIIRHDVADQHPTDLAKNYQQLSHLSKRDNGKEGAYSVAEYNARLSSYVNWMSRVISENKGNQNPTNSKKQVTTEQIPLGDLDYLYKTLTKEHPKLQLSKFKMAFDSLYLETKNGFAQLNRNQAIMRLMKLVASLNDGHTSIARAWDEKARFRRLPLRLYWFSEGIQVSRIDRRYKEYVGMKVVKIGLMPIEEVIKMARPYIHADNEMAIKNVLPSRLGQLDFLIGLGLTDKNDSISFTLADDDQNEHDLTMGPSDIIEAEDQVTARAGTKPPLYLSNFDDPYWYRFLPTEKIMYFQFNEVTEMDNKPLKEFVDELFGVIDSLPVEKLVIDIRNNNGGDNSILKPLIHAIIRSDKINKKGSLYTIIGRLTFSAAVSLTTELETHTKTVFVGEPTSASPNHYGETQLKPLPNSGIKVLYSSQFWQGSLPWDDRPWVEPSIYAELSIKDYKNARDPCLEAIKNLIGQEH